MFERVHTDFNNKLHTMETKQEHTRAQLFKARLLLNKVQLLKKPIYLYFVVVVVVVFVVVVVSDKL